jgi:hypothetical protein
VVPETNHPAGASKSKTPQADLTEDSSPAMMQQKKTAMVQPSFFSAKDEM